MLLAAEHDYCGECDLRVKGAAESTCNLHRGGSLHHFGRCYRTEPPLAVLKHSRWSLAQCMGWQASEAVHSYCTGGTVRPNALAQCIFDSKASVKNYLSAMLTTGACRVIGFPSYAVGSVHSCQEQALAVQVASWCVHAAARLCCNGALLALWTACRPGLDQVMTTQNLCMQSTGAHKQLDWSSRPASRTYQELLAALTCLTSPETEHLIRVTLSSSLRTSLEIELTEADTRLKQPMQWIYGSEICEVICFAGRTPCAAYGNSGSSTVATVRNVASTGAC